MIKFWFRRNSYFCLKMETINLNKEQIAAICKRHHVENFILLLLLFCFISTIAFSQEYHFDFKCYNNETQIKGSYKGNKRTNIIYFNSQNENSIAYDYYFSQPPRRSFLLYDFVNNVFFSYSINNESKFSSLNFIQEGTIKNYPDERKIERVDVENFPENTFIIKSFPTKKSKKANLELKIIVEKSGFPMPKIRFMDLTHNIHSKIYDALLLKLDSPNYRIVDVTTNHKNGVIMHNDFSKCEKINLKFLTDQNPKLSE